LIRRGIRTIFWTEWVIELFRTSSDLALWVTRCVDIGGSATKHRRGRIHSGLVSQRTGRTLATREVGARGGGGAHWPAGFLATPTWEILQTRKW
jgi:hypothetical protein